MDQYSQFNVSDPVSPPPPLPPPLTGALDALSPPPLATYPSKEALFEAIQTWAKPRGCAFTTTRSMRMRNRQQKVFYACDRHPALRLEPRPERIRDTQSRGTGCLFQVVAVETPSLGWVVKYRPESKFLAHNHPPSLSPVAHPSHRRLEPSMQNTAQNLFSAGKSRGLIRALN
jgi:hypothetical protein